MRPQYESEQDRKNEEIAINRLMGPNDTAYKLPIKYELDYFIMRKDEPHALVEVRCRTNKKDAYPDFMISMKKILTGIQMSRDTGIKFLLVVDWADVIGYMRIHSTDGMRVSWGGRTVQSRGDWQDSEPMYHIKTEHFITGHKKQFT